MNTIFKMLLYLAMIIFLVWIAYAHVDQRVNVTYFPNLKFELEAITEEKQGIREVFQNHRNEVNEVPIDNPIIRLDLNTPESYEEAISQFGVKPKE